MVVGLIAHAYELRQVRRSRAVVRQQLSCAASMTRPGSFGTSASSNTVNLGALPSMNALTRSSNAAACCRPGRDSWPINVQYEDVSAPPEATR